MNIEKKVLWIDDRINNASMWGHKERLKERGFSVTPAETIEEALDLMMNKDIEWSGIIVDIAIPPSREEGEIGADFGPSNTENGRRAGLPLLKKIDESADFAHLRNVPIIVFTQVNNTKEEPLTKHCESKEIPLFRRTGDLKIEEAAQEYFKGRKR